MSSFAWGGERIGVPRLQVPDELLDEPLRPKGETLVPGDVGKAATAGDGDARVEVFISELIARPGTQFRVTKRRRAGVIDDLQTELRISEKGKKTGILTVALDGPDGDQIARILDAIARTYVRQNVERKSAEAAKTLEFLQEQLPLLKKNVDTSEAAVKAFQLKQGSVDLTIETQAILDRAVEIEKALSELDLNRAELRQRFTENHPVLRSLREKGDKLRAERAAIEVKMRGLPQQELESVRLARDSKVASELYFLLVNKSQELNVVKSGAIGNVRILDTALKPYEPVSPKKLPVLALSLLLGLAGGIAAAFAKRALDYGVEDPAEIEAATGVSVYASVPYSNREVELTRKRTPASTVPSVLAAIDPSDLAIESLRSLRTALQFALVDATNNVVTVCGPSPGVGKSFLSANLAYVLATGGKRVLLIDGDLRRGRLHRYLGGKRMPGLSEVVSGQIPLADATRKTGHENLEFIATGKLPPNPAELVGSPRFSAFLSDVAKRYDLVLLDTPPILAVTDGAVIGRHAGVNLLAIRAGRHPMREIGLAIKHFLDSGVTIHGAVDGHTAVEEVLDGQANLPHRVSARPDREKIHSGVAADHSAVRHRENGRRVEQDQVVSLRDVRKECAEPGASHQLGRIRRQLAGSDELEVLVSGLASCISKRDLTTHHLGESGHSLASQIPVEAAAPQIPVDEEDALSPRSQHIRQVRREEGLPDPGTGAADSHDVVGRIDQRELKRCSQAAQALDREIRRVDCSQYRWNRARRRALPGELNLPVAVGHAGVNRDASCCFDLRRILDAMVQRPLRKRRRDAARKAKEKGERQHRQFLGADRLVWLQRRVEYADVADRARLDDVQLLRLVDQQEVELRGDLRVAGQPHGL